MLCCSDWCPKYKDCARAYFNSESRNSFDQVESLYNYGSCSIQAGPDGPVINEHYVCGPTSNYGMFIPKMNNIYTEALNDCVETKKKEMPTVPTCPNCGCTRLYFRYKISTLMGFTQIINNGELEACDPNWHTSFYTCTKCGHNFSVKEHCGKIESINDEGPSQKVPTIDTPITVPDGTEIEDCTISLDECNAKGIEIKYHQELFDDLCKEVENVKKQLEQLNIDIKDIKRKNILF